MKPAMSPPPVEQPLESSGSPLKPSVPAVWQFIRNFFRRVVAQGCSEIAGEMAFDFDR
jgi:hypothetical protein